MLKKIWLYSFFLIIPLYTIAETKESYLYKKGLSYLIPNLINDSDPSMFENVSFIGMTEQDMWDPKVLKKKKRNTYHFKSFYSNGHTMDVYVSDHIKSKDSAQHEAQKYSLIYGRLHTLLIKETIYLHLQNFDGNLSANPKKHGVNIFLNRAEKHIKNDCLEEILMHEACHAAIDYKHKNLTEWKAAQLQDHIFINKYGFDNPEREDLATTIIAWYAVDKVPNRIPKEMLKEIKDAIPSRLNYFRNKIFIN